ncbi:MAG: phage protein GemA/Gp16 family protein [Syntrophales bacterium]
MENTINKTQLRLIHIAISQLRLDDVTYRAMLSERFGVSSSKELSYREASELIDFFKKTGFRLRTKRNAPENPCWPCVPRLYREKLPDNVLVLASPQQLRKIEHLAADIKWRHWNGFRLWMKKYFHIEQVKTSIEASIVIEALKDMWKRQNGCACKRSRAAN